MLCALRKRSLRRTDHSSRGVQPTVCVAVFDLETSWIRRPWPALGCSAKRFYLLTYLLTHSMVQSTSWEANWFAASQEIPPISRNPKVHYRTHKRPPPVSIVGQPNPVHIPTSYLLEIHPNIIHPSTPRPPQWSLSLRLPHQTLNTPLSSPIRATCPAHLILLDLYIYISIYVCVCIYMTASLV